jgi:hypothetical protein
MNERNSNQEPISTNAAVSEAALKYLEEHDHFTKIKSAHVAKLTQEKKEREAIKQKKEKDKRLAWRKDGEQCYRKLKGEVSYLRFLLIPHHHLKQCFELLEVFLNQPITESFLSRRYQRILSNSNITRKKLFSTTRTELIFWKRNVLKELLRRTNELTFPWERVYPPLSSDRFFFRRLFRYYAGQVHIDKKSLNELRKKRYAHRYATNKMNKIKATQDACAFIATCKSIQHYNPKGCSNCGVIFIGGSLEGAVPYVKSVSRDTGVFTLVTLEFEWETLQKEEEIQVVLLDQLTEELNELEEKTYSLVISALQRWWRVVLVWKRTLHHDKRKEKSAFYYRIRRLVKLKKEVDQLIKERDPLDLKRLSDKYWDVQRAMEEYCQQQTDRKHQRMIAFAKNFRGTLKVIVEEAR